MGRECWERIPRHQPLVIGFRLPAVAGKTLPAFPAHAQPAILRISQEAHETRVSEISATNMGNEPIQIYLEHIFNHNTKQHNKAMYIYAEPFTQIIHSKLLYNVLHT